MYGLCVDTGNYPEMSVVDWTNGKLNARGWTMKLLIDGLGNANKRILRTNVTKLSGGGSGGGGGGGGTMTECKILTQVVDQDMQGGDVCEFNMTTEPSHTACGKACCAHERCDHFVSVPTAQPLPSPNKHLADDED